MFLGLFGADVGVKLTDADRERLLGEGGGAFGPAERPMGGYVALPLAWRGDAGKVAPWVDKALDHVGALPQKTAKAAKKR
jgi:hypothetical protein